MTERAILFISNLISYKPKSCVIRLSIIGCIGFLFMFMTERIAAEDSVSLKIPYLTFSIGFIGITEFNVLFNFLISKYGTETIKRYRISLQILVNIVLILIVLSLLNPMIHKLYGDSTIIHLSLIFTCLFVVFLVLTISLIRVVQTAYESQNEVERLYRAKAESEYQAIVEQVNPHFLFNNLSVLKSLIMFDQDKAVKYVQDFTDIYRYVLQIKNRELVPFSEELTFVKSYIALHQERLGSGFLTKIDVQEDALSKMVVPIGLQTLVENALKHNVATKSEPLTVEIIADADSVTVKNNLNKKDVVYSSRKGLKNILDRYKMFTDQKVKVQKTETEFIVSLPLI